MLWVGRDRYRISRLHRELVALRREALEEAGPERSVMESYVDPVNGYAGSRVNTGRR
jgi:hypothetical protein